MMRWLAVAMSVMASTASAEGVASSDGEVDHNRDAHAREASGIGREVDHNRDAHAREASGIGREVVHDEPDPAVEAVGNANLETEASRRGVTFAASVGGAVLVGFGIDDSVGRGGALSLRLGHVATPNTVVSFELGLTAVLHTRTETSPVRTNTDVNLMVGGQRYVNQSLWLRFAGGLGIYQGRDITMSGSVVGTDITLLGPVVLSGLGVDLFRLKSAAMGLELATTAMANREGVLISAHASVGITFD